MLDSPLTPSATRRLSAEPPPPGPPAPDDVPVQEVGERAAAPVGVRRRLLPGALLVAVFLAHFRPWQTGLLEEWGLAASWQANGWGAYVERLPLFAARPLHLLPHYLGLALPLGGFAGEFLVLGVVAVATVLAAVWAMVPVVSDPRVRWMVAAVVGLHPWWSAGDLLRFLPAQVSVLLFVVWLGGSIRYLGTGRARHLWGGCTALAMGLLTYQLLALTALLVSALLVLVLRPSRVRASVSVLASGAVVLLDTTYTLVLVPRFFPTSYEAGLRSGPIDLLASVHALARTTLSTPELLGSLAVGTVLVAALALGGSTARLSAAWLLVALALAPLTALALAASPVQLNDPDRVGLPVGVAAWVVLVLVCRGNVRLSRDATVCGGGTVRRDVTLRISALVVVVVLAGCAALVAYVHYSSLAGKQRALLDAVETVRVGLPAGGTLVVADGSGTYGDVYTLLPPYLQIALSLEQPTGPAVELCTPAGVIRRQTDAMRYPIATTPDCSSIPGFAEARELVSVSVDGAPVTMYSIPG